MSQALPVLAANHASDLPGAVVNAKPHHCRAVDGWRDLLGPAANGTCEFHPKQSTKTKQASIVPEKRKGWAWANVAAYDLDFILAAKPTGQ